MERPVLLPKVKPLVHHRPLADQSRDVCQRPNPRPTERGFIRVEAPPVLVKHLDIQVLTHLQNSEMSLFVPFGTVIVVLHACLILSKRHSVRLHEGVRETNHVGGGQRLRLHNANRQNASDLRMRLPFGNDRLRKHWGDHSFGPHVLVLHKTANHRLQPTFDWVGKCESACQDQIEVEGRRLHKRDGHAPKARRHGHKRCQQHSHSSNKRDVLNFDLAQLPCAKRTDSQLDVHITIPPDIRFKLDRIMQRFAVMLLHHAHAVHLERVFAQRARAEVDTAHPGRLIRIKHRLKIGDQCVANSLVVEGPHGTGHAIHPGQRF
mmetsp:Transcript_4172/g.7634  ORF Transcript_4172/g.7634 Transcript_4172/m.7634 type:complete len:320 (-) Transcript_4172:398-1357(-)